MFFFNGLKVNDERIEHAKNKIYRELYTFISIICLISIGVKYYIYGRDIEFIWTEVAILLAGSVYYLIRSVSLGIYSDEVEIHDRNSNISMSKKTVLFSVFLGLGFALLFATNSAVRYGSGGNEVKYFITVFVFSLLLYVPVFLGVIYFPHLLAKIKSDRNNRDDR